MQRGAKITPASIKAVFTTKIDRNHRLVWRDMSVPTLGRARWGGKLLRRAFLAKRHVGKFVLIPPRASERA